MKIKPKKSLGQNFLTDNDVIRKIVESAGLKKEDVVLEIGPGRGILTEALASECQKVIAVEIDSDLVSYLKKKFEGNKSVEIVQGDILQMSNFKFPMSNQIQNSKIQNLKPKSYKLIANLPYYITSPIIRKFLESKVSPTEMILMVQKEVAERIVAKPGEMGLLSISVQYYAKPEILFFVPRTAFEPVPEVDSAVIRITHNSQLVTSESKIERDKFFRVVRAGFCAKRKMLSNNLSNSFHLEKKEVEKKLAEAGLDLNVRAQELSVEDWKKLAKII